jgi:lipoate-protein ligase A
MRLLDLTLPTPEENLALDEALLDEAEETADDAGVLRLWESPLPFVVLGRSSRIDEETQRAACRALGLPILRRVSGGAAIVAGPGCLMYAVVLSYRRWPQAQTIDGAHQFVLGRLRTGLLRLVPGAEISGISDLALGGKKFSGNSLRCKRTHLLYHGTLLYDFPMEIVEQALGTPPRQPDYRLGRSHREFVANIPVTGPELRRALAQAWGAAADETPWPQELVRSLVAEKYAHGHWHQRL